MLEILQADLGSLHCHVWETYYESSPTLDISFAAMNKR